MEPIRSLKKKLAGIIELIKFEHSIFALPFAMIALFMVYDGTPDPVKTFWIIVCMVSARSASMAFNRLADYSLDLKNPRTMQRPLQAGKVSIIEAWLFTISMTVLFVLAARMLNNLAFVLSFTVIPFLLGYSFTKRFTFLSHFLLGLMLGLSPVGVWVAVKENIPVVSIILCLAVTFWVAGFDIIYALQDIDFDKQESLASIPARFGVPKALFIAFALHTVTIIFFILTGLMQHMGILYYTGICLIGVFLFYEHVMVWKYGLSRINMAFFTINGVVSIAFFVFSVGDIYLRRFLR